MKVVISEIPEEGIELELKEDISSESVKLLTPVTALLRLDKRDSEVFIKGVINGEVEQQCSRCLKQISANIRTQINVIYHPAEDIAKEEHHELKGEELDTGFYRNDIIDTDDILREQLFLNIPMKPLCSAECKGLCPKCGADLNTTKCNCEVSEIDERLAVLEQLLKKQKSE
ncbi:MAG: DUF177 domain-containing protein [Thermodesulfovibrionales bacterium]|nr:DUF177 domain-containing protein [Thermodesulfovibrionales bacterium]